MRLSPKQSLRVGFVFADVSGHWTAGAHYLKNLFIALRSLEGDQRPGIALLTLPHADSYDELRPYIDHALAILPNSQTRGFWQRQIRRIQKRLSIPSPQSALTPLLRQHQVDCVFAPYDFQETRLGVPLLGWITDFQHMRLPDMFTPEGIEQRNRQFRQIAHDANRIVVSSRNVLEDLRRFAPSSASKGRVLSFVAQVPATAYDVDPAWICEHYHLPKRFFYLPNQFWRHKNHLVVIEALGRLKAQAITIVCTGNTNDYRAPLYFSNLLVEISRQGLRENVIVLGTVPHDHIFHLMRQSLAIIQPSLFEGWSTTVEEAKSVGKRVILSDIPVHREQNPPGVIFFDPLNPDALAQCLTRVMRESSPGPDFEMEASARQLLPERTRQFGQTFIEIVREVEKV